MPGKSGLKHSFTGYLSSDMLLILLVSGYIVLFFKLSSASFGKDAVQTRRFVCFKIGLTVSFSVSQRLTECWNQSYVTV